MSKAGVDYPSWLYHFPSGRHIYYEGDTPGYFIEEMEQKFNFNPVKDNPKWREEYARFGSFGFFCPPHLLDALYGNDEYPMGS